MQKKMIALAIAGLASSAALAQTQVTLYGVADAGQAWVKGEGRGPNNDQKRVGRLDSNSSLLGFKGTEDLGNGLKAIFQMETQLDISNGSGFIGGRDTYVGLGGNFGTVLGGILTHPMRLMGAKVDILPGAAGFGTTAAVTGQISGLGVHTGADDRATNTLAYITPIFGGGFSATAAYINGESRVEDNNAPKVNAKAWQIAGQYDNGPLYVALAYHKTTDMLNQQHPALNANCGSACSAIGAGLDATVWRVAGIYTAPFGTRFSALYDHTKLDRSDVNETTLKRSAWSLGVAHTFGNNTLGLQYARSGDTSVSGGPDFNDSTRIWTLAYQYALSKRTMLQARYSDLKNDRDGKSNFYLNSV
ncbi:MAG: porin, partial [Desulfobulbus sp.]|nr:porin [Desulfobulbus sp.]